MKLQYWLFFVFFTQVVTKKLFTKVINTSVYDSSNLCSVHHMVLLQEFPFEDHQTKFTDLLMVDFSPSDDITELDIIGKLFLGKKINGKIRIFYVDNYDLTDISETLFSNQYTLCSMDVIQQIYPDMHERIQKWDPAFQLYTHNCQHFGRYICMDDKTI